MPVTRSGGTGSRRGDDEGGVTHRETGSDRVDGGADARQQLVQLRRWKVAVAAGRGTRSRTRALTYCPYAAASTEGRRRRRALDDAALAAR